MGLIHPDYHDAFLSYARDDNVLHDDVVRSFQAHLKPRFQAACRLRVSTERDADLFLDVDGLPANGDLSAELRQAIDRSAFLIIFVGRSYLRSAWCGRELEQFMRQFEGVRTRALERTVVVVLHKAVVGVRWGPLLDRPEKPIYERFYDEETGDSIPAVLEDRGQAVPAPRFLRAVRKIAETMADRATTLRASLNRS